MDNILKVLMTLDSKQLVQGLKTASGRLKGFDQTLKSTGRSLTTKVSAPLAALGGLALKQSMNFQRLRVSLETLAGGAEKGSEAFEKLVEFSAKTPFQLNELVRVNNMLMGFGLNTEQARESLKLLGDVAAISGGNLTGMGVAFGQSAAEGRIMTRDLLQFINNGVPMLKLLAEELGTTTTRVREMASEGALTFPLVVRALERATSAGGMFENGMEKLSKTMAGTFSNIKDNLTIALATLGDQMVETFDVEQLGKDFVQFIKDVTTAFKQMEPATRDLVVQMGAFAATAGPIMYLAGSVIPKLVKSIRLLIANPIVAGITAVSTAMIMLADNVGDMEDASERAKNAQNDIKKFSEELAKIKQTNSEEELKKFHDTNIKLQKAIKANAEVQIEFAKGLGDEGIPAIKKFKDEMAMAEGNIKASEAALKSINKQIVKTGSSLGATNKEVSGPFDLLDQLTFEYAKEPINQLADSFSDLVDVTKVFNEEAKELEKFDPNNVAVAEDLNLDGLDELINKYKEYLKTIEQIALTVGDVLMGAFESFISGGDFFQPLINSIKALITKLLAAAAAAAVLAVLMPGGIAKIGGVKAVFSALSGFNIPEMANGGIVSGPTLGLIGEYSGARSNPEVVAPLDKLKGMIGQSEQNVNVGGEFRIQGQDLVVALQRAERNRKRIL